MNTIIKLTVLNALLAVLISSCASFTPGWNEVAKKSSDKNLNHLMATAQKLELTAATADEVNDVIAAYLEVEKVAPTNYSALWKIGSYHILMGAAHSPKIRTKKWHYREAIKYCEKAMYTNIDFANEINAGKDATEACQKLTINEIDAMGFWYTARFYYYKECLKPIGRILNTKIPLDNNNVIVQIDKIDPRWAGGGNNFSRALYYIATPEKFGGSKEKADEEFTTAIQVGPNYLVNRWGRAKYLYSITGNNEGFKADMNWVIAQDPSKGGNPYAWNVYFQNDAKKALTKMSSQ